jgi:hypothetical protein
MGSEAEAEAETDTRPLCACVRRSEVWAQNLCMTFFLDILGKIVTPRARAWGGRAPRVVVGCRLVVTGDF